MAHTTFPSGIPAPQQDGACDHLNPGTAFPTISLPSTSGSSTSIASLSGLTVLFCYPRTAAPDEVVPDEWNSIPGARGCTPQACSFRDASSQFLELGVSHIFGCSTQTTEYQQELKTRTHLPYQLLSDQALGLVKEMGLPTFEWKGEKLIKRMSVVVEDGKILKVFYPVFPPDQSANEVLQWLKETYTGREKMSTGEESEMMRNMQHRSGKA